MIPTLHSHCSLAAITADDQGTLLLYIVSGIIAFLALVASVAKIYEAFFKTNKASTEAVTRAEFEGSQKVTFAKLQEHDKRLTEMDMEVRNILNSLNAEMRGINRSIGKLEGLISAKLGLDAEPKHAGPGESTH